MNREKMVQWRNVKRKKGKFNSPLGILSETFIKKYI
jgi:hypothetical protein